MVEKDGREKIIFNEISLYLKCHVHKILQRMDICEMYVILLKKIEELTIHN